MVCAARSDTPQFPHFLLQWKSWLLADIKVANRLSNLCRAQTNAVHDRPSRPNFLFADAPIDFRQMAHRLK